VIFHGVADTTVPIGKGRPALSFSSCGSQVVTTELHTFAGLRTFSTRFPRSHAASALLFDLFLDRYVINPRPFLPNVVDGADVASHPSSLISARPSRRSSPSGIDRCRRRRTRRFSCGF